MAASIPRVVSLVPSATETLRAWGVDPIACSRFCEQADLPTVGGTKDPDVAAIVELRPDLVVVDREENRREDHDALVSAGLAVHVLHVVDLAHLDAEMAGLAAAVGARWTPLGGVPSPPVRARAWVPIWRRPWMALGEPTYGSAVLRALGVANVAAEDDAAYPPLGPAAAAARGSDLVVAPSEPYPFAERHRAELAVAGRVHLVDGHDLLWWGVRTAGALDRLGAALAP
jgi:ABC-type Fe3+-hydroxamate transport system substrate-binding protein